ncbi:hypothetical protein IMG5_102590 [Ichthyophthirius multifiliis]|uniref:ABC transmembrane type-1 domain-containing protein n=1 Tax=Ichthyophthirius multifiliis TaxID=5932 RepID=G0QSP3_ICHMU|nr:hypothetical protein IMG5_102590 [Ichthyophthirius multifiliis]EGR31759.1 hypothetical protein IMG5_102590 [Ichthyophthirius multifiliis]|eukprot:XP_004035245.1 hypothetical protein IMG5_102590 [Ichthyophthirius multifiliis]
MGIKRIKKKLKKKFREDGLELPSILLEEDLDENGELQKEQQLNQETEITQKQILKSQDSETHICNEVVQEEDEQEEYREQNIDLQQIRDKLKIQQKTGEKSTSSVGSEEEEFDEKELKKRVQIINQSEIQKTGRLQPESSEQENYPKFFQYNNYYQETENQPELEEEEEEEEENSQDSQQNKNITKNINDNESNSLIDNELEFFQSERIIRNLKIDCFQSFIYNDVSFHDKQLSGKLVSRLSSDILTLKSAVSGNISTSLRNILVCLGNVIMLFLISPSLFFILSVVVPIFLVTSGVYGKYLKQLTKKYQDYCAKTNANAQECFQNIKTIKAFCTENKEVSKFATTIQKLYQIGYKKSISCGLYNGINSLVSNLATLGVLWYGGYLVLSVNNLTSGQLVSVILYTGSLASSTSSISSSFTKIVTASGATTKLFKLMDKKPKMRLQGGLVYDFVGRIQFNQVAFYYKYQKNIKVLENFNLQINPGERIALVGPSGSGKSTIIRLIERFYDAKQGTITNRWAQYQRH